MDPSEFLQSNSRVNFAPTRTPAPWSWAALLACATMSFLSHSLTAALALFAGVMLTLLYTAASTQGEELHSSLVGEPRRILKQEEHGSDAGFGHVHPPWKPYDPVARAVARAIAVGFGKGVPDSLPAQVGVAVSSHAWAEGVAAVKRIACSQVAVTDKVTAGHALGGHQYNLMYGMFLYPLRGEEIKMLEIGLGCGMKYGAGASALLWREMLPHAELWEAEVNGHCVEKHRSRLKAQGINPLIGSQRDPATLQEWMRESGGAFDVIIDDGGHSNLDITTSFDHLWPHVAPGGLYFVEDLQVGRRIKPTNAPSEDTNGEDVFSDRVYTPGHHTGTLNSPLRLCTVSPHCCPLCPCTLCATGAILDRAEAHPLPATTQQ